MAHEKRRIRDPVHGLIVFDLDNETDRLAWRLIETPEFQRLRRIRQLGVSDLVFPGATHSRFAHSIGVFHNARKLIKVIEREEGDKFDNRRAKIIQIAALLHDIGHGPFSHAFEDARRAVAKQQGHPAAPKHEKFTEWMIRNEEGAIRQVLDSEDHALANEAADVFAAEGPTDIYHAVVSSSFDADRLDYLVRDRYMTGTGAGAIDRDWLLDNLTTCLIQSSQIEEAGSTETAPPSMVPTFVFKKKARQAAEDFLLARYRLYTQVYLHKATRGFEKLATALFVHISETSSPEKLGLAPENPIVRFFAHDGGTLEDYLRLDDTVVWGAIECMARGEDERGADLAGRLLNRKRLAVLDLAAECGHSAEALANAERRLEGHVSDRLGRTVFRDRPSYNLYSRVGEDAEKEHTKVRILVGAGEQKEITEFPDTIIGNKHHEKSPVPRYYFLNDRERETARKAMQGS